MLNKLKSRKGESIIEALAAMVIILMVFLFMTTSIITATRINSKIKENKKDFDYSVDNIQEVKLKIDYNENYTDKEISVNRVESNAYYYYSEVTSN